MPSIPNWTGVDSPKEFLTMPNTATGGYFWMGMNIMVFLVIFISLAGSFGWEAGLLSAGFIALLMSIFLVYLGLLSFWVVGTFIALILITAIYIIWSNRYD